MSSRRFLKSRRTALAGGVALVLGGMAVATVRAQTPQPHLEEDVLFFEGPFQERMEERRTAWLKAVADKLGVTPERLDQALQEVAKDQGLPPPLMLPLPKPAFGAAGDPRTFAIKITSDLAAAAKAIGITEEQLRNEGANKSLSEVARAHNVDPKVVADALEAQRREDIEKAIASGKFPGKLAEKLMAHIDEEIDRLMEHKGVGMRNFVFRLEHAER